MRSRREWDYIYQHCNSHWTCNAHTEVHVCGCSKSGKVYQLETLAAQAGAAPQEQREPAGHGAISLQALAYSQMVDSARAQVDPRQHNGNLLDQHPAQMQLADKWKAEAERLRKELEAAHSHIEQGRKLYQVGAERTVTQLEPCDHEATISKLRERNESQARTLQKFEERIGVLQVNAGLDARVIADLSRQLDKLRRGR